MAFAFETAATRQDWIIAFRHTRGNEDISFYECGPGPESHRPSLELEGIPNLGKASTGMRPGDTSYLAIPKSERLHLQRIERTDGTTRYTADQLLNLDSFILRPGGSFGDRYFIVGEISSVHNVGTMAAFAKRVYGRMRRHFYRGNDFRIGPECFSLYNSSRIFTVDHRIYSEPVEGLNSCFPQLH